MNRSLWVGIAATFLMLVVLVAYFYSKYIKPVDRPLQSVIPESAVAIAFTSNTAESVEILKRTSMWQMLQKYPSSADALQFISLYDSILKTTALKDGEMAVSLHVEGDAPEWMLTTHIPENANMNEVLTALNHRSTYRLKPRTFDGIRLYDLQDASGTYIGVFVVAKTFIFYATTGLLAEMAIRKLKYKVYGQTDEITLLQPYEDKSTPFRLYVNYRQLGKLYACFSDKTAESSWIAPLQNLANWSMLNVSVRQNELVFKGISLTDDTVSQFLDLFRNQNPVLSDDINRFVPVDCPYFIRMGFSDYLSFKNELDDYHERLGFYTRFKASDDSISALYKIELNNFRAVIGKQALLGSLLFAGRQHSFALIKTVSAKGAAQLLENYQNQVNKRMILDSLKYGGLYKGFTLNQWPFGHFLSHYLGSVYSKIVNPFVVIVEDVIILAEDHETLKHIIDAYLSGSVLSKDELYAKMITSSGPASSLDLYVNTPQAFSLPLSYVNSVMYSHLNRNEFIYKKFTALHFQFASTSDKFFYTQFAIHLQPDFEEKQRLLWQVKLDTTPLTPPVLVFNKAAQVYDVMIQDIQHTLYCIASSGTLKWKIKMSGPIISNIHSVTYHPSGKWGYLLNTTKSISLIDTSGKNVYGYPVYLPGTAIAGLVLTDFYNDSTYQFFIPLNNKRIMGYTITGKALPAWNPKVCSEKIVNLKYGNVQNEPILYATTDNKKLYIWKPDGTGLQNGVTTGTDFIISEEKLLVIDSSTQTVTRYVLDENLVTVQPTPVLKADSGKFEFLNRFIIGKFPAGLYVYDLKGYKLTGPQLRTYAYTNATAANDYMLFDSVSLKMTSHSDLAMDTGFPVDASAPGTLGMLMNDGVRYLIVPVTGNYLNAFRLK